MASLISYHRSQLHLHDRTVAEQPADRDAGRGGLHFVGAAHGPPEQCQPDVGAPAGGPWAAPTN
jgi:hypothetical protein